MLCSLPRVVRDVESLGQEASLVKTQMAALMRDVEAVSFFLIKSIKLTDMNFFLDRFEFFIFEIFYFYFLFLRFLFFF